MSFKPYCGSTPAARHTSDAWTAVQTEGIQGFAPAYDRPDRDRRPGTVSRITREAVQRNADMRRKDAMPRSSRHDMPAPWLEEKVYQVRRQRTVDLVKRSIDALLKARRRISLASIVEQSKHTDPEGVGISRSAIYSNQDAYILFKTHCSAKQDTRRAKSPATTTADEAGPPRIAAERDLMRVRQHYRRMTKEELANRLIHVEQAYAHLEQQFLEQSEELLQLRMQRVDRASRETPQERRRGAVTVAGRET